MIKKLLFTSIIFSVFLFVVEFVGQAPIQAQTHLQDAVNEQLKEFDIEKLDNLFNIFNSELSFKNIINNLINGDFSFDKIINFNFLINIFRKSLLNTLYPFILIFVVTILGYILKNISNEKTEKSVSSVVHLGIISIIAFIVIKLILNIILETKTIFISLKNIMEVSFPIILTLMATSGASASVSVYQPVMALLSGSIIELFINILLPIFIVVIVLTIGDNLTDNIKLSNVSGLLTKSYKWVIGVVFSLFASIITIFGITAGSYDTLSFKTAQYSIKNFVPFVGGYLSGGFNIIASSCILLKNSIGLACFVFILITILKPILNILLIKLFLGLLCAILQNIADKKVINFCSAVSKALNMLIAIIFVVSSMFLIFLGLCILTGNVL